jgi:CRISPR-associated protein Csb2
MLAFEVEYLLGRVFSGDFRDREEPEWPPHPARLFSALVAACHETRMGDGVREALLWLEKLGAPCISASAVSQPEKVKSYVPTNYAGKGGSMLPEGRKQPRVFPSQTPERSKVYFVWPHAQPAPETRNALEQAAHRIGYLGKAASFVRVAISDVPPESNYVPDSAGAETLRVFGQGRLAELEELYELDRWSTQSLQQAYRCTDSGSNKVPTIQGTFDEMIVFRPTARFRPPIESTLTLSKALRAALMSKAEEHNSMTGLISGHERNPHCAYVPLPLTGSAHADGQIMGIAVVLPKDSSPEERRKVLVACEALKEINLKEVLGHWTVELAAPDLDSSTLRTSTWTRAATRWATATPILLDRFPKPKGPTVKDLIATSCERIGLPAPETIEHGPYPFLKGSQPVPAFRLHRKSGERARWGVHAVLTFPEKVRGPVLLGAGRYFGLGLLRPFPEELP